jgi:hypothetical protein
MITSAFGLTIFAQSPSEQLTGQPVRNQALRACAWVWRLFFSLFSPCQDRATIQTGKEIKFQTDPLPF